MTDYREGFQYLGGVLQFIQHAEGYVNYLNAGGGKYNYVFNYLDHLGNVRASFTKDPATNLPKLIKENHYYPFGLKHSYNSTEWDFYYNSSTGTVYLSQPTNKFKYQFQGQEYQGDIGLNWYSFKWRNYDPSIGRFFNIDPLSEKYSYQSHYNFSENRVIDGRELEGLEVELINPKKPNSTEEQKMADKIILRGARNIPYSRTMITLTGHGNPKGISNDLNGEKIRTAGQLNAVLNRNSADWKNKESGKGITVVLYSCRTGADLKNKDGSKKADSFARTVSASKEFKDVEIIAPDQRVYFTGGGPIGTYKAKYAGPDDEYKANAPNHNRSDIEGNWNVFKNGELLRSYKGDWKPTENPTWWDKLTKEN